MPLWTTTIDAPPRYGEPVALDRFADMETVDRVTPLRANPDGSLWAWQWRDGTVEHADRVLGGVRVARTRCDVGGYAVETATWHTSGAPETAVILGATPHPVDVSRWVAVTHGPIHTWLPAAPVDGVVRSPDGTWLLRTIDAKVRPDAATLASLQTATGGVVLDVANAPVDGHAAFRVTLDLSHPTAPRRAEVFAVPVGAQTWVVTFVADRGTAPFSLDTMAPGRASLLLADVEAP